MKSEAIYSTKLIKNPAVAIVNADASALKTLYTAGADDAIVRSIMVVSDDTSARNVTLYLNNGVADFPLCTVALAIGQGTNGTTASIDLLSSAYVPGLSYDQNGKRILPLQAGYTLKIAATTTITAGKQISVVGVAEEY